MLTCINSVTGKVTPTAIAHTKLVPTNYMHNLRRRYYLECKGTRTSANNDRKLGITNKTI